MTDEDSKQPDPSADASTAAAPAAQDNKKPPGVEHDKPPPDEFLGRFNKKKKPGKQKPVKTQVEEQIDAALASSSVQAKRKAERKKQIKYGAIGGGVLILAILVYLGLQPFQGTMAFGICKVFLEGTTRYPQYLRLSTVEEFETSVRIWYTEIDSFGAERMEPIQCYYKQVEGKGTQVDKVLINRREVDPKVIENFNRALPAILGYPPDLTIPYPLPDSLEDLQLDMSKFMKPIL